MESGNRLKLSLCTPLFCVGLLTSCSSGNDAQVDIPSGASCLKACTSIVFAPVKNSNNSLKNSAIRCMALYTHYFPQPHFANKAETTAEQIKRNGLRSREYVKWERANHCQQMVLHFAQGKGNGVSHKCEKLCLNSSSISGAS